MTTNVGSFDRILRIVLALVFAGLYFSGTVTGTVGLVLVILGAVFLLTAVLGWCGLYTIFGISTCPVKK
ncbi:MAG: DUF2892 domain-containing protein [Flavobacteriales bacterium]|nr:DUF2892 domain-containing protein [Flavobacteriales bacterium]